MRACEARPCSCVATAVRTLAGLPVVAKDRAERAKLKPPHDQLPKRRVRPLQRSPIGSHHSERCTLVCTVPPCRFERPHKEAMVAQCSCKRMQCRQDLWAAVASNVSRPVAAQRDEASGKCGTTHGEGFRLVARSIAERVSNGTPKSVMSFSRESARRYPLTQRALQWCAQGTARTRCPIAPC